MTEKTLHIYDRPFRWLGIPAVGILVYFISGFASATPAWSAVSFLNYCYFTLISLLIWTGNAYTSYMVRHHLMRLKQLYLRIPARMVITAVVSLALAYLLLHTWNHWPMHDSFSESRLTISEVIIMAISLQISSIYEIVYLNKERASDLVHIERTEKLKVQAQLDALKSQIDPHFIFNSLNTLSYLISEDRDSAKLFNDTLAKVYRYILLNKEKDLVLLKEEVEFASNYFYLLKIRYQAGLNMIIKMENIQVDDFLIPPLSLQALIENAIKHNHFSEKNPLDIRVLITAQNIQVSNKKQLKKFDIHSSRIGLSNLGDRYLLIVQKRVLIEETPELFTVILPTLQV